MWRNVLEDCIGHPRHARSNNTCSYAHQTSQSPKYFLKVDTRQFINGLGSPVAGRQMQLSSKIKGRIKPSRLVVPLLPQLCTARQIIRRIPGVLRFDGLVHEMKVDERRPLAKSDSLMSCAQTAHNTIATRPTIMIFHLVLAPTRINWLRARSVVTRVYGR